MRWDAFYIIITMECVRRWWFGLQLSIKTAFPRYGDSYIKEKTVLFLTWRSLYIDKTMFYIETPSPGYDIWFMIYNIYFKWLKCVLFNIHVICEQYEHFWRSPLRQFARAGTIDEYDVTMLVSYIRVTSQINCGDVTILKRKDCP